MSAPDEAATDAAAHREAQEALPWLANGSLGGAELARVQAHVRTCTSCRAELARLRMLRAAGPVPEPDCDPGRALARLLPQLDAPATASAPSSLPGARWRERIAAANDRSWLRAAIAVQCGVIGVLAFLLAGAQGGSGAHDPHDAAYRVLGAGKAAQARLVVMFKPETPEAELRRIVRAHGARIVGGPTVADAWLLDADGSAAHALAGLRAEDAVTLAEALAPAEAP